MIIGGFMFRSKIRLIVVAIAAACSGTPAHSLEGGSPPYWLNLDYTYTDFAYKEPGYMNEKGRLAGIRGEVGINFFGMLGVSAGGEYQDGHLNYDGSTFSGTPVKQVTKDYVRRTEYLAHFFYGPMTLSAGMAERYWFDDLVISYRRRTRYNYIPVYLSYRMDAVYLKFEHDIWQKGWNKSHMSDVNASARDVEFTLGTGTGMGVELGYLLFAGTVATRIFVAYHKWDVKESDVQSDGTQNLIEPKNNTTEIKVGLGLGF